MSAYKDLSLICLEIPWVDGFRKQEGYAPQNSVNPFLNAFAVSYGVDLIHRNIYTKDDLARWAEHAKGAQLGKKIVWLAGHGDTKQQALVLPRRRADEKAGKESSLVRPSDLNKALLEMGELEGIIVNACSFGNNSPEEWLDGVDATWAIAFAKQVYWSDGLFFSMKALEWMYDGRPTTGSADAMKRFRDGIESGQARHRDDAVNYSSWAEGLGVRFFHRVQRKGWATLEFGAVAAR